MTRPDLDAIRARCKSTLAADYIDVGSAAHGYRSRACHFARTDIPALLAYIDELEEERDDWREAQEATQAKSDFWRSQFRATYTIGETEWAHRIAVAEQRFVDAEREIAELKARIAMLEAMKP